jgi:Protein of unknown function (DUF4232)
MTITPTRRETSYETTDPAELLIEEARRLGRRRRMANGLVFLAGLLMAATLVSTIAVSYTSKPLVSKGSANTVATSSVPTCSLGQLSVTTGEPFGAGGTDGGILLFRNISSRACALIGYPNVIAVAKNGATIKASQVPNDMLGGWDWSGVTTPPKPPSVVLSNKSEVASDWYQYSENGPAGYTLFHASTLGISLPGSTSVLKIGGSVDAAEGKMVVTPFVAGMTGTAEPRTNR